MQPGGLRTPSRINAKRSTNRVRTQLYWTKEITSDGNLNAQEQMKDPEMINKEINITKTINIYLLSFLVSASLKDIML